MEFARGSRTVAARRCPLPGQTVDLHTCPVSGRSGGRFLIAGVRLQFMPGETLRIQLVNWYPAVDAKQRPRIAPQNESD
jgi:hypothetical protein